MCLLLVSGEFCIVLVMVIRVDILCCYVVVCGWLVVSIMLVVFLE